MARVIETDVLVIGAGGAGTRAAVEARRAGARVCMVLKRTVGKSGATTYPVAEMAAFNAPDGALDPEDSPEEYLADIIGAGEGMADPRLARFLAEKAVTALHDLESFGVQFEHEGDGYKIGRGCFSTRPRMHVIKDHGIPIVRALGQWIREHGVQVVEKTAIVRLLIQDGRCSGAVGLDEDGETVLFSAGAVILCTGGASQMFKLSLNPVDVAGDGYALGYQAGAELVNMEFLQMGVGLVKPIRSIFNSWLWQANPRIINGQDEEFMPRYLPADVTMQAVLDAKQHFPFSSSDVARCLEIAIQKELVAGRGTESGGVTLDFSGFDPSKLEGLAAWLLQRMFPITRDFLLSRGVDIQKDPVEVAIFGHAVNGGLYIDTDSQTTVPGLFAAGETAGGPHGANRLGGNMMVTCQVFGRAAGAGAARFARESAAVRPDAQAVREEAEKMAQSLAGKGSLSIAQLTRQLQELMWRQVLVVRSEESLKACLAGIREIRSLAQGDARTESPREYLEKLSLQSLLLTAELVATAALTRTESRGSHYREDFPAQDLRWDSSLVLRRSDAGTVVVRRKLG